MQGKVEPFQLNYLNTGNDILDKNTDSKVTDLRFVPVSLDVKNKTHALAILFFQEENLRAN